MASTPLLKQILELPPEQRLQLVEDIWDSIATDADGETYPVSEADKALIDERLADLEANPGVGAPWPEVRARIVNRPK